jgi:diguanylate cyclase (GGDEF)-like protein
MRSPACLAFRQGRRFPDAAPSSLACEAIANGAVRHVCLPLSGGGEVLGVIHLRGLDAGPEVLDQTLLSVLVDRAGLAVSNIRIREDLARRSVRDPLTGLLNRGYLEETLRLEERRALRSGSTFCVLMIDADHFKRINDEGGHEAGDRALRFLAGVLGTHSRSSDVACRYGGEELALVLLGAGPQEGLETAERIRHQVESTSGTDDVAAFTVSVGVACFPGDADTGAGVRQRADEALYAAKARGRNRVVVADPVRD